ERGQQARRGLRDTPKQQRQPDPGNECNHDENEHAARKVTHRVLPHVNENQRATTSDGGGLDARRNERRLGRDGGWRRRTRGREPADERKSDERGWRGGDPRRQLHGRMRGAVRRLAPGMRSDVTGGEHEKCRQRKNDCERKNDDAPPRHGAQCSTGGQTPATASTRRIRSAARSGSRRRPARSISTNCSARCGTERALSRPPTIRKCDWWPLRYAAKTTPVL